MATRALDQAHVARMASVLVGLGMLIAPGAATAQSRRILQDRGPIQSLDLYWGNASPERAPVGPFTFVSEDRSGTNPKAILRDAKGVRWAAKWDEEVRAEVAATRLAWAMGLAVEETYYVEDGLIVFPNGKPSFRRLGSFIDKNGRFRSPARFERRDPDLVNKGKWRFGETPLMTDPGYSILIIMNVVLANWDAKDSNNKILSVKDESGTTDWYMIGDYGACFGKMGGGVFKGSKYKLKDYLRNRPVITSVDGQTVYLGYSGFNSSEHESVPLAGVREFARRAAGLSLKQVEDAFRAAHASEDELHGFAQATYQRIQEVVTAGSGRVRPPAGQRLLNHPSR